jgi:hypothetical protein
MTLNAFNTTTRVPAELDYSKKAKEQARTELEALTAEFLANGGSVQEVEPNGKVKHLPTVAVRSKVNIQAMKMKKKPDTPLKTISFLGFTLRIFVNGKGIEEFVLSDIGKALGVHVSAFPLRFTPVKTKRNLRTNGANVNLSLATIEHIIRIVGDMKPRSGLTPEMKALFIEFMTEHMIKQHNKEAA